MEIKIEGEHIKDVVSKAVLEKISEQEKQALLEHAVKYLISEQRTGSGYYEHKFIPIQEAFNDAARKLAVEVAAEWLKKPENKEQLEKVFAESMTKVLRNKSLLSEAISRAVEDMNKS